MDRRTLCAAAVSMLAGFSARAEEPLLLNADQISFQLGRTRSMIPGLKKVPLPAVTFQAATSRLTDLGMRQLDALALALASAEQADRSVTIVASAAPRGPYGSSYRRAVAVRDYLVERGDIDPRRLLLGDDHAPAPIAGIELVVAR